MTTFRPLCRSLLCLVTAGCTYNIVLEQPAQPTGSSDGSTTAIGPAAADAKSSTGAGQNPQKVDPDKVTAPPANAGGMAAATPAKPAADKDGAVTSSGSKDNAMPTAPAPTKPAPAPQNDCDARVVSRNKPCADDPDPCGLNSGWEGDEYCLKPPPPAEGVQIHFGPTTYDDPSTEYAMEPGFEVNNSMLTKVPLTETRYWDHVTVHFRPGLHHWTSMGADAGSRVGVYPQNDTGCGSGRLLGGGGFGGGQNLIYDNPPHGIAAPENEGLGRAIEGNANVCVGLHAYNFTDKPRLREMWVNLYFVDRDKITQSTGSISMIGGLGLSLPPGEEQELHYTAAFSEDGRIIQLFGRRNRWTPRLSAWLNDELIYDSHDWLESITYNYDSITMNPPIDGMHDGAKSGVIAFKATDRLSYSCFVRNESDQTLRYQNEVDGGEMCNLWGITVGGSISGSFQ